MRTTPSAADVLNREFLELRAKLLQSAASLDRIQRAPDSVSLTDSRLEQIRQALDVLRSEDPDRAERIQLVFSLPYEGEWRAPIGMSQSP